MTSRLAAVRLNKVIAKAMAGMLPPDDLTVTEWAEQNRRLSAESAAEPGPWRTERTPYLREPMNAWTDPKIRHIVMVAASQVGKSEFLNNCIGYVIDQDPGSILFVHPTTIDAKEYSKLRIAPMIRDCPTLRKKVSDPKSRDSGNTILQKTYPGGILTMCGSTEAHALASKPIRYVLGDERDRWALSAGNEGDPWDLAMARQTTFYNAKSGEVSTPTVKNASAIEAAYATGTMERWKSRCPHCGEYHEIQWADIRFEHDEIIVAGKKTYKVRSVCYACPGCGCISTEAEMKRAPARWEADNPAAYEQGTRSFWLNAFVSQWASWESIILKYLNAIGSTRKMQVVYNTCFGELWEDRGDLEDEDSLMARREEYPAELPEGVLVLTAGVDTQDDRMEYEIVGHGHFGETWGIEKGIIMGRPDDDAVWAQLDELVFDRVLRFENGVGLKMSMSFVDEGGHFTQEVRMQCRARLGKKVFCIKGMPGSDKPYTAPPKKQKITVNTVLWSAARSCRSRASKTAGRRSAITAKPPMSAHRTSRNPAAGAAMFLPPLLPLLPAPASRSAPCSFGRTGRAAAGIRCWTADSLSWTALTPPAHRTPSPSRRRLFRTAHRSVRRRNPRHGRPTRFPASQTRWPLPTE